MHGVRDLYNDPHMPASCPQAHRDEDQAEGAAGASTGGDANGIGIGRPGHPAMTAAPTPAAPVLVTAPAPAVQAGMGSGQQGQGMHGQSGQPVPGVLDVLAQWEHVFGSDLKVLERVRLLSSARDAVRPLLGAAGVAPGAAADALQGLCSMSLEGNVLAQFMSETVCGAQEYLMAREPSRAAELLLGGVSAVKGVAEGRSSMKRGGGGGCRRARGGR